MLKINIQFDPTNDEDIVSARHLIDSLHTSPTSQAVGEMPAPTHNEMSEPDPIVMVPDEKPVKRQFNGVDVPDHVPSGGAAEWYKNERKADVTLDTSGFPWDKRIHSSGKTQNNDGSWKLKKGVAKELVEQVRFETTKVPEVTQSEDVTEGVAAFAEPAVIPPEVQQPEVQPMIPSAQASLAGVTWEQFLARLNKQVRDNEFDQPRCQALLNANSIKAIPMLNNRPDLWDVVLDHMGA